MENVLQINNPSPGPRVQVTDALPQILGQGNLSENAQIGGIKEAESGFSLGLPELSVRVDDAVSKQIPRPPLHKHSLGEDALILEDEFQVLGVVNESSWGQGRDCQGHGLVAELALALIEPGEQLPSILEEPDAIANKRQGVWGLSARSVSSNYMLLSPQPPLCRGRGSLVERRYLSGLPLRLMTFLRLDTK